MKTIDYAILGAGPAGCQLAYFLEQQGKNYLVLERGETAGIFFKRFPIHRQLISINKVHTGVADPNVNLRWDWNSLLNEGQRISFREYANEYFPPADKLVNYLNDFVNAYELKIQYNTDIVRIGREGGMYVLRDSKGGVYHPKRLIVATGVTQPWLPDILGIEHATPYTNLTLDKSAYVNRRVLILGKGNSAFEAADYLTDAASLIFVCSPNNLKLAWRSHFVGHLRAVNNNFLDTYHLKSQNAVMDATVLGIEKADGVYRVSVAYENDTEESEVLEFDEIIAATGFRFDFSIFDEDTRPQLGSVGKFPAQTAEWESVNQPHMYFAGTITQERDYRKYTSGFIHGFRYNVRLLAHILMTKYEGLPLPHYQVCLQTTDLAQLLIDRFNTSSCLWQQPGFMGDVLVVQDGQTLLHFPNLTVDYIRERMPLENASYFIVTMEFGDCAEKENDHVAIKGFDRTDPTQAHKSSFLHPIVRAYRHGRKISEQHLMEDLKAEWKKPVYHQVMSEYLRNCLTAL